MKEVFINNQVGIFNKDLQNLKLESYLKATKDFKSSFDPFSVIKVNGFNVIDESTSCEVLCCHA